MKIILRRLLEDDDVWTNLRIFTEDIVQSVPECFLAKSGALKHTIRGCSLTS